MILTTSGLLILLVYIDWLKYYTLFKINNKNITIKNILSSTSTIHYYHATMDPSQAPVISGYVHPESNKYTKRSMYKTLDSDEKRTKKAIGTTLAGKTYSRAGVVDDQDDVCPECNAKPIKRCYCSHSDKVCEQGHTWYTNRDGEVKLGDPHTKRS